MTITDGKDCEVKAGEVLSAEDEDKTENKGEKRVASKGTTDAAAENDLAHVTTFEDLLEIVGTSGRWNLLLFLICSYAFFVGSMQTLSYQFLGATPDHWCRVEPLVKAGWTQEQTLIFAIPVDGEGKHEKCQMYDRNYTQAAKLGYEKATAAVQDDLVLVPCYSRDFNRSQYLSTVTTEWDLVCERRALYSTTQAASQIGKLFGYFFLGYLMDTYGRRILVLCCAAITVVTAFGAAVSPSLDLYIFLKVAIDAANSGASLGTFVIMMENCGKRERTKMGTLSNLTWALGYMAIPGIAYYIRTWKWLQVALSVPTILYFTYYWLLPESPRWLILRGRHQEAIEVLKWAAAVNHRELPPDPPLLAAMQRLHMKVSAEQDEKEAVTSVERAASRYGRAVRWLLSVVKDYFAVLRVKEMRRRALVVFYCWFSASLVYYGISLNATNISANVYLYVFLGGVLEIPSCVVLWPLTVHFGRVKSLVLLDLICAFAILILTLLIYFYPNAPVGLIMLFSLAGKMAVTANFSLIWMFTLELFPTKYRSLVAGQASVNARIGSISSPYINDLLGDVLVWAPSAVFFVVSLLAAGLSLLLPETKGRGMPEGCNFEDKCDQKGNINKSYLPEVEASSSETRIVSGSSGASQPDVASGTRKDAETNM